MRVTMTMMSQNSLRRLQSRLEGYERTQEQLSTGRRINRTSDDPSGANRAMTLKAAMRARTQEVRNADDGLTYLDRADSELQGVLTVMQRVRTLALRAGNDIGPTESDAIAQELSELRDALVGIANAENGGRPLFGGTADGPAVQQVAGTWTYTGDGGEVVRRVSDQDRVVVNRTADDIFGFGSTQGDLFTIIDDLAADVTAQSTAGVQSGIGRLDAAFGTVTEQLSSIGATTNRVENARLRNEDALLTLRGELSEVEDVEFEEAIMNLRVEEVAYEATLQALGRSLPQSLVAFLR